MRPNKSSSVQRAISSLSSLLISFSYDCLVNISLWCLLLPLTVRCIYVKCHTVITYIIITFSKWLHHNESSLSHTMNVLLLKYLPPLLLCPMLELFLLVLLLTVPPLCLMLPRRLSSFSKLSPFWLSRFWCSGVRGGRLEQQNHLMEP